MSRTPSPRPFRLSDALWLIVALALGLAAIKFVDTYYEGLFEVFIQSELLSGAWDGRIIAWSALMMAFQLIAALVFTPLSIALLALRMRRPRPKLRRVWRQPGAVACLACLLTFSLWGVTLGGQAIIGRRTEIPWKNIDFAMPSLGGAGFVILGVWLVFWLGRIARPEKSWIDRSGRALGVTMILVFLLTSTLLPAWLDATMPRPVHSPALVPLPGDPAPPAPPVPPTAEPD